MRHMYLLAGTPASGKSTFIQEVVEKNQLGRVISWDTYRSKFRDPWGGGSRDLNTIDAWSIAPMSKRQEKYAINQSYSDTEMFMQVGETIFVDNTNTTKKNMSGFLELAEKYGYRTWVVDVQGDLTLEELKERNRARKGYKRIPVNVVERFYENHIQTRKSFNNLFRDTPYVVGLITPDEVLPNLTVGANFTETTKGNLNKEPVNLADTYKRVVLIGDIQGMGNTLEEAIYDIDPNGLSSLDTLWVFMGDLFDRGNNPVKVADLVFPYLQSGAPNVKLINGNHESLLMNVIAGVSENKDAKETLEALTNAGYTLEQIHAAIQKAVPAAELKLESLQPDHTVATTHLYLSHAGVHPNLYANSTATTPQGELVTGVYAYPLTYWETGYSTYYRARDGYSSYTEWAPALNTLYSKATKAHNNAEGIKGDMLIAVCGHRGGYGNPNQYQNLIPLESEVEYENGYLSVMVYTNHEAAYANANDQYKHVWVAQRKEYAGDSDRVRDWVPKPLGDAPTA